MGREHEPTRRRDGGEVLGPRPQRGQQGKASSKVREPTERVDVVMKVKDIARLDALHALFSAPWHKATRSDIVRGLLLPALDEAEKQVPTPAPRKRARVTS